MDGAGCSDTIAARVIGRTPGCVKVRWLADSDAGCILDPGQWHSKRQELSDGRVEEALDRRG